MPSVLLLGENGQVGAELLSLLAQFGDPVALDRQDLDLCRPDEIRRIVRHVRPQLIVNAAAYTAVDKAETEHSIAYAVNAEAPGILAQEARKIGAALVHYSTDYIFDGSKQAPYLESDSTNPLNVYGKSKLAGEFAIRQSGALHLIFRVSWVYATHGQNFLLAVLRLGSEREELRMVSDQVGTPNRAQDIAQATATALTRLHRDSGFVSSFEKVSGTYHLSASGVASRFDFSQAICDEMSSGPIPSWASAAMEGRPFVLKRLIPITTAEFPTPAVRPLYSALSNERFCQTFGIVLPDWRTQLHHTFSGNETK
jgi:dTDP-4-dehydrorhamnose reductase